LDRPYVRRSRTITHLVRTLGAEEGSRIEEIFEGIPKGSYEKEMSPRIGEVLIIGKRDISSMDELIVGQPNIQRKNGKDRTSNLL
jgi:hypothetical protein